MAPASDCDGSAAEVFDDAGDTESVDSCLTDFAYRDDDEVSDEKADMLLRRSEGEKKSRRKTGKDKQPTVTSFKERVKKLLSSLTENDAETAVIKRRVLAQLTAELTQFLADLDSAALTPPGMERLKQLLQQLRGDLTVEATVSRLWSELREALQAFGKAPRKRKGEGRGEGFWK